VSASPDAGREHAPDLPTGDPHPATGRELWVCQLGVLPYGEALALQERLRDARQHELIPDVLLCLEHWPVYTRGRRTGPGELPMGEEWYRAQGIEVVDTDRGGKVTYHGPGQLVGYPIVRTSDVVAYVRTLERALVAALAEEGIAARARAEEGPDYTGVWVGDCKIASIGVHVQRGVTTHGFALNVENDLQPFGWIIPCGLADVRMTSVIAQIGTRPDLLSCARRRVAAALARELGLRQRIVTLAALERAQREQLVSAHPRP
jgi:lipoyl(octanoyl) transferase